MASISEKDAQDQLRRRFIAAREALGTQDEVAQMLGVTPGTVSRKERGETPIKARDVAALEQLVSYQNDAPAEPSEPAELNKMVPRGTSGHVAHERTAFADERRSKPSRRVSEGGVYDPAPGSGAFLRQIATIARHFEYEMVRIGAEREDLDYVHFALNDPQSAKLSWMGGSGRTLSAAEQEHQFQLLTEALRKWVMDRIADRKSAERQSRSAKASKASSDS